MILYNIFSLIATFTLILLYLHLRISKPVLFIPLNSTVTALFNNYFFVLFLCSIFILSYLIVTTQILKNKQMLFVKYKALFTWLEKYNIFFRTYSIIFDFIGVDYTVYLVKYAKIFIEYSKIKYHMLIVLFVVSPRVIVTAILLFEICVSKTLHYYFYIILILLLPLFFRFFLFILTDLSPRLLPVFQDFLKPEMAPLSNISNSLIGISFKLQPKYEHLDLEDFLYNFYYPMFFLPGHLNMKFLPLYNKLNISSLFMFHIIHAGVWGYLLYFNN